MIDHPPSDQTPTGREPAFGHAQRAEAAGTATRPGPESRTSGSADSPEAYAPAGPPGSASVPRPRGTTGPGMPGSAPPAAPAPAPATSTSPPRPSPPEAAGRPDRSGEPPATGNDRVDTALARLAELDGIPVTDHVPIYEDVHQRLADVLSDVDAEEPA